MKQNKNLHLLALPFRHRLSSFSSRWMMIFRFLVFSFSFSYFFFHSSAVSSMFTETVFLMVLALCEQSKVEMICICTYFLFIQLKRNLLGHKRASPLAKHECGFGLSLIEYRGRGTDYDGCSAVPTQRVLQDPGHFTVSVWHMGFL